MAGDVRNAPPSSPEKPDAPSSRRFESFSSVRPTRPPSANLLPGGTENTAGGRIEDVSFGQAIRNIKLEDFTRLHQQPCVRDALMPGLLAGFGVGGLRAVLGAPIPKSCNWAVGSFTLVSLGTYEYCQARRRRAAEGMRRAVEIIDLKKLEKEKIKNEERKARRQAKLEEEKKLAEERSRSKSWKFW